LVNFSYRLKEIRKSHKLRQKDLAKALGLAQTTIANYEQGTRFPDEIMLNKIATYFNISLDYLLGRTSQKGITFYQENEKASYLLAPIDYAPLSEQYFKLLQAGNNEAAYSVLVDALKNGGNIQKIYLEVLQPALIKVGEYWETNKLDVSHEHYFSEATKRIMAQLLHYKTPINPKGYTLVGTTSGGEYHDLGLRMVTDFLELEGLKTYFLGTNLPTPSIIRAIEDYKADFLAISVTMPHHIDAAENLIKAISLSKARSNVKMIVGGQAFNNNKELWKKIGADGYANNALNVVELVNKFISSR